MTPPVDSQVQLCVFHLGPEEFAVDLMRVEEILHPQPVTAVPRAPPFVEGVVNLRGSLLPVVDLRKRLGTGPPPQRARAKLLICLLGRRRVGLLVDGVSEVSRVPKSALKPAPGLVAAGRRPYVVGAYGPPERLRLLLDVKALLSAEAPP